MDGYEEKGSVEPQKMWKRPPLSLLAAMDWPTWFFKNTLKPTLPPHSLSPASPYQSSLEWRAGRLTETDSWGETR